MSFCSSGVSFKKVLHCYCKFQTAKEIHGEPIVVGPNDLKGRATRCGRPHRAFQVTEDAHRVEAC